MGDVYRKVNQDKKERHSMWHKQNMATLNQFLLEVSHLIKNYGQAVVIYANEKLHKPQVVFYPSTGRWRSQNKTHSGGAKAFLNWYKKQ